MITNILTRRNLHDHVIYIYGKLLRLHAMSRLTPENLLVASPILLFPGFKKSLIFTAKATLAGNTQQSATLAEHVEMTQLSASGILEGLPFRLDSPSTCVIRSAHL